MLTVIPALPETRSEAALPRSDMVGDVIASIPTALGAYLSGMTYLV
jgi:hypothetical protein